MKKSWITMVIACVGLISPTFAMADEPGDPIAPVPETASAVSGGVVYEGGYGGVVVNDMDPTGKYAGGYPRRRFALIHALRDRVHPAPFYAHGRKGYQATWTHQWNQQQAAARPWHAGYYYPQYGMPTALVVPPTASYITNYSWGVGNTTSTPIYHQFGNMGTPGYGDGGLMGVSPPPLWPSNTNQFGIYPVRGPW